MNNFWLGNKFKNFSDKDLAVIWWWQDKMNFHDLSEYNEDGIEWTQEEMQHNDNFIYSSYRLEDELEEEVLKRFVPCIANNGYHQFAGRLEGSVCNGCGKNFINVYMQIPCPVVVVNG